MHVRGLDIKKPKVDIMGDLGSFKLRQPTGVSHGSRYPD
jgi:hypothetical protein